MAATDGNATPVAMRPFCGIKRLGRDLCGNRRGATLIEFAVVSAPFIALLLAVVQTTLTMFTQQVLETVAEKSNRLIQTGAVQRATLSQSAFRNQVCSKLPAYLKCQNLMVDVQVSNSFGEVSTNLPAFTYDNSGNVTNTWSFNPGGPGDVVVVRLMYLFPVVVGPLGFNLSNMRGGKHLLVATAAFKNETYQ